jgi:hypothetical protein
MKQKIPIACMLTDKELQERRKNYLAKTAQFLIGIQELENGFSYKFPVEDSILEDLITVINLERKCCPFLNFKLVLESQNNEFLLVLTGENGAKEMIKSLFEWN